MNSTPKLKATGSTNGLISLADEGLAHAYEQLTRADEELGRVNEQLSKLEHDARDPSAVPRRRPLRIARIVLGSLRRSGNETGQRHRA